jgi:hypothetical protein
MVTVNADRILGDAVAVKLARIDQPVDDGAVDLELLGDLAHREARGKLARGFFPTHSAGAE